MQLIAIYEMYLYTQAKRRLVQRFERRMKKLFLQSAEKVRAAGGTVPSLALSSDEEGIMTDDHAALGQGGVA